ncbi:bifunctional hydroxymethylpyrimidine kinase/phosphomethylpyrimidine kinase [Lentisphaera marina]|uniref:bifunctional hydroxymethylpyrimidine kinase/phosphomethylpyrimidine kinase n=1 Tax=Lentisphaera marina TaxID=1111041 RepID=UPI002365A5C1|nr:bifunctional hydroxymethylpyrimidine kinase/phosphomethylpyrimidine kinase [Lentisphaera marina]MDD7986713.1 bifunctional hydroxymethylpyrimidine kinase/phosphomethylpyrimidine kinase [Lentisphaera marina]
MNTCLTVAGSDSGGEAGIQADLQVFNYFNCHALSVLTATTAQSRSRVLSTNEVSLESFSDQLEVIFSDFEFKSMKTGMLVGKRFIECFLEKKPGTIDLVVDPLMVSTSGTDLLNRDAWALMKDVLIPQASIVTPNFPELHYLLNSQGIESGEVIIQKFFEELGVPVYLKGGHNPQAPSVDYFINSDGLWTLTTEQLLVKASHGTGCRLSAALAAGLANDLNELDAAIKAKQYLSASLKNYKTLKSGQAVMAPLSCSVDEIRVDLEKIL